VTFSNLSTAGQTTINGSNITTGTLNANLITSGTINANYVSLYDTTYARGGFSVATGNDGVQTTYGAKMYGSAGVNGGDYVIATNAGAALVANSIHRIWASNGGLGATEEIATSSDRNLKNSISYDLGKYESLFMALRPCRFKMNNGQSGRYHTGFIAQEVGDAILAAGLTTGELAAYVIRQFKDETGADRDEWALRYTEFISLNTMMIQKLYARVEELEGRLSGK